MIVSFGLTIQSLLKGTFWQTNLSSGLGGAFLGIALTGSFLLFLGITNSKGETLLVIIYLAVIAVPIAAIIGALLFVIIGMIIRSRRKSK